MVRDATFFSNIIFIQDVLFLIQSIFRKGRYTEGHEAFLMASLSGIFPSGACRKGCTGHGDTNVTVAKKSRQCYSSLTRNNRDPGGLW
jgi:hypothetical protein